MMEKTEFERIQKALPVANRELDAQEIGTVNARDLHAFLQVKTKFADWIRGRASDYAEGIDFVRVSEISETSTGATAAIEYHLTLDMAKELGMLERNEMGRLVRRYFIECEKIAKALYEALTPGQKMRLQADYMIKLEELQKRQEEVDWKAAQAFAASEASLRIAGSMQDVVKAIEARVEAMEVPVHGFSVMAYAILVGQRLLPDDAKVLGRKAAKLSRERGHPVGQVRDTRFGVVGVYLEEVLKEVFADYFRDLFSNSN